MKRRSTKPKQEILEAFEEHHLLSAGELENVVDADQSTIYRNLKRLEEDGVLRSIQLEAATKYELVEKYGKHDHFVCSSCQEVRAIFIDEEAIKPQLPADSDFSVTVHGKCSKCKLS